MDVIPLQCVSCPLAGHLRLMYSSIIINDIYYKYKSIYVLTNVDGPGKVYLIVEGPGLQADMFLTFPRTDSGNTGVASQAPVVLHKEPPV